MEAAAQQVHDAVRQEIELRFGTSSGSSWDLFEVTNLYQVNNTSVLQAFRGGASSNGDDMDVEVQPKFQLRQCEFLVAEWTSEVPPKLLAARKQAEAASTCKASRKDTTLEMLFEWSLEPEQLSEEDILYCSSCKEHRRQWKKVEIWSFPPVLVEIHGLQSEAGSKLNGLQGVAKYLDAKTGRFCVCLREGDPPEAWKKYKPENLRPIQQDMSAGDAGPPPIYDLGGLVRHVGHISFGHYVAYVRSSVDGRWRLFDDEDVTEVTSEQVEKNQDAYVLFYIRRDCQPSTWASVQA